jgi:DNA sulfur modification protein DndE
MELAEERKVSTRMTQTLVPAQPDMRYGLNKVYLGGEVCKWLRVLKGRLQMEEGAICRLALCYSLGESYLPDHTLIDQEGGKEYLVPALMGPPHISFLSFALLKQRMYKDGLDPDNQTELESQFQAHLSRGMLALGVRVKNLADVGRLIGEAQDRFKKEQPVRYGALGTLEFTTAEPGLPCSCVEEEQEALFETHGPDIRDQEPVAIPAKKETEPAKVSLPPSFAIEQAPGGFEVASLWGALLPAPVAVEGQESPRKKRRRRS